MGWQEFEEQCCEWLRYHFGDLATFDLMGGSNSNVSDILVTLPNEVKFYIEVKDRKSQCSQFVLTPDFSMHEFVYSVGNKLEMNPFTSHLIEYMNEHFNDFCKPTTAGKIIDPKASEAAGHIRYQHMVKGVEFFISHNNLGYCLIPLSFFGYYFDIEAVYRRKKSGSHDIAKKDEDSLNRWLIDKYNLSCLKQGRDFLTDLKPHMVGETFEIEGNRYMFREEEGGKMSLRGLSSTANPSVIFTITLKDDVEGLPNDYMRYFLKMVGS